MDRSASPLRALAVVGFYVATFWAVHSRMPPSQKRAGQSTYPLTSLEAIFLSPLGYILAVMLACRACGRDGKSSASPRCEAPLRAIQTLYNIAQIVICSYIAWGLFPADFLQNPFSLGQDPSTTVELFVYYHYLTKFMDWFDTLFSIVAGRMDAVSFLHVFHHASIGPVWGYLLWEGYGSGTVAYGAFINSVTHVIMYTHYLITSLGLNNPLKRQVTQFQLAQFLSCVVHAALVCAGRDGVVPIRLALLQCMYHPIMLYLFGMRMYWAPTWLNAKSSDAHED
eukprot:g3643.t1